MSKTDDGPNGFLEFCSFYPCVLSFKKKSSVILRKLYNKTNLILHTFNKKIDCYYINV